MRVVLFLLLCTAAAGELAAADAPEPGAKKSEELAEGSYRVEVEPIVEPPGDYAIYRIRVWTAGEQRVSLAVDERCSSVGNSLPVPGEKFHRLDFIIVGVLRAHPDPVLAGKKRKMEIYASGIISSLTVNLTSTLDKWITLPPQKGTKKVGETFAAGRVNGHVLEVSVSKPK